MPTPLRPDDHPVLTKLYHEVLPWMIAGANAGRQWFVWFAAVYAYGGELATALVGLGVGAPVVGLFTNKPVANRSPWETLGQDLSGPWFLVGAIALVLWVAIRLVVARQDAVARARYAKDCAQTMKKLHLDLYDVLRNPKPAPEINKIMEAVMRTAKEAIEKEVWPLNPPPPGENDFALELGRRIADIRNKFMPGWERQPEQSVLP